MKWLKWVCALCIVVGCSMQQQAPRVAQQTVRLGAAPEHVQWLREHMVVRYEASQQEIRIDVLPTPFEPDAQAQKRAGQWSAWFESPDRPDAAMVDMDAYRILVERNALQPLDPLAKRLDEWAPAVLAVLRQASEDGQLYGLAPFFGASALFYRTDILQEAGTRVPEGSMVWDDVFAIAQDAKKRAKHGFAFSAWSQTDFVSDAIAFGAPLGVRIMDPIAWRMTVDTDTWENVVTTLLDVYRSGTLATTIRPPSGRNARKKEITNWFISGDVPLVISDHTFVQDLIRENEQRSKNNVPLLEWGIAPVPEHAQAPNVGGSIRIPNVFVLPARVQTLAWDVIQYVHSAQYAKLRGAEQPWLPTNMSVLRPRAGLDYDAQAFATRLPSVRGDASALFEQFPRLVALERFGERQIARAFRGEQSIRQALRSWASEGDALLASLARQNAKSPDATRNNVR
jgi:multiple sugar transport system substrate-binding protein